MVVGRIPPPVGPVPDFQERGTTRPTPVPEQSPLFGMLLMASMMMMLAMDCICALACVLLLMRTIDDIGPEIVEYKTTLSAAAMAIPAIRIVNTLPGPS